MVGPGRKLYLLDTELANVFVLTAGATQSKALCKPRMPVAPSDISADAVEGVWILSSRERRVSRFDDQCNQRQTFTSGGFPIGLQVTAADEIVVLTSTGSKLFEVYNRAGKLIRSFGERLTYGDAISDQELSAGHLVADRSGGFYFSFNYPPLIRHYAKDGRLLAEIKPQSDVRIDSPQISSRQQGNRLSVSARYQILVLDLGLDARGRLIMLMSGENKFQALSRGSRQLVIAAASGKQLGRFDLDDGPFNRLATGGNALYMLRNRAPLRLDRFAIP